MDQTNVCCSARASISSAKRQPSIQNGKISTTRPQAMAPRHARSLAWARRNHHRDLGSSSGSTARVLRVRMAVLPPAKPRTALFRAMTINRITGEDVALGRLFIYSRKAFWSRFKRACMATTMGMVLDTMAEASSAPFLRHFGEIVLFFGLKHYVT